MSNDLISRKAVIDYLREQQAILIIEENKNNPVTHEQVKGCIASVTAFQNFIVQCPTAYDVDKVINMIESKMFTADLYGDEWDGQTVNNLLCLGDIYDIVKEGGV